MYRKRVGWGRPIVYKTWLGLWMDMKGFSIDGLARALCYSGSQVKRWRKGEPIGRHAAQLIRARYPDVPVPLLGGCVPTLQQQLPINARSKALYRFLMRKMGVLEDTPIWPVALEHARGIVVGGSKPKQVAVAGGQVDADGV